LLHPRLPRQLAHEVGWNEFTNLAQREKITSAWKMRSYPSSSCEEALIRFQALFFTYPPSPCGMTVSKEPRSKLRGILKGKLKLTRKAEASFEELDPRD
jgi:hypothetical protein